MIKARLLLAVACVTEDLPKIRCPALVITTDSQRRPVTATMAELLPRDIATFG